MDVNRKKTLLAACKDRKPEMGVIAVRCTETDETFLTSATDTTAYCNRIRFQLSAGNCPNQRLQQLWRQYGQAAFSFEVVKRLKYDDPQADHTDELADLYESCLLENPTARRLWQ